MIRIIITFSFFTVFNSSLLAQQFSIAEDKGKFGLTDQNGKFLPDKWYTAIYPCSNSGSHLIGDNGKLYLISIPGKEKIELDEYFENLKIESDTCKLSDSDMLNRSNNTFKKYALPLRCLKD